MKKPFSIFLFPSSKALTLCCSGTVWEPPISFTCPNPVFSTSLQSTPTQWAPNSSSMPRETDKHSPLITYIADPYSAPLCWDLQTRNRSADSSSMPWRTRSKSISASHVPNLKEQGGQQQWEGRSMDFGFRADKPEFRAHGLHTKQQKAHLELLVLCIYYFPIQYLQNDPYWGHGGEQTPAFLLVTNCCFTVSLTVHHIPDSFPHLCWTHVCFLLSCGNRVSHIFCVINNHSTPRGRAVSWNSCPLQRFSFPQFSAPQTPPNKGWQCIFALSDHFHSTQNYHREADNAWI